MCLRLYNDYYPFGMPMPDRVVEPAETYRYTYQGQEKDPETGKEAFELRLWDSRIGRWLTTDPYGQYSSPYLGMGNNPINGVDPDGGFFGRIRSQLYAWWNGGSAYHNETTDKWYWKPNDNSTLNGNIDDGYHISDVSFGKSFGYSGFGKISTNINYFEHNLSIDAGLVYGNDYGFKGKTFKGPTITIFQGGMKYNDKLSPTKYNYYPGKDGVYKGSIAGFKIENGTFDYKSSLKWKVDSNDLEKKILDRESSNIAIGTGLTEFKINHISKKGMNVHFGLQEDVGATSPAAYKVLGLQWSWGIKTQMDISWKF